MHLKQIGKSGEEIISLGYFLREIGEDIELMK